MRLSSIGTRNVVSLPPAASAQDAARTMEEREVGSVLVGGPGKPLGIVTDRDLVLRVLDKGLNPARVPLSQVMSAPVVCVRDEDSPLVAGTRMCEHSVRRLPVVDAHDRVVAMVTFDDLLRLLGRTHREMADLIETFPVPYQGG